MKTFKQFLAENGTPEEDKINKDLARAKHEADLAHEGGVLEDLSVAFHQATNGHEALPDGDRRPMQKIHGVWKAIEQMKQKGPTEEGGWDQVRGIKAENMNSHIDRAAEYFHKIDFNFANAGNPDPKKDADTNRDYIMTSLHMPKTGVVPTEWSETEFKELDPGEEVRHISNLADPPPFDSLPTEHQLYYKAQAITAFDIVQKHLVNSANIAQGGADEEGGADDEDIAAENAASSGDRGEGGSSYPEHVAKLISRANKTSK